MTKRIVFDTNTFISAYLLRRSITRQAFEKAQMIGNFLYSDATLLEVSQTFNRSKFDKYISVDEREEAIDLLAETGRWIQITTTITDCRDPKDNKFLELAIDGRATCIVTGDKDLLVLHPFKNIPIITPADFLEIY